MMRSHRLVGVTFGELSAWHANGETRLLRGRITDIPENGGNGDPMRDGYAVRMLLRRLPPLSLDDEEGVLVVWLGHEHFQDDDQDSQLVRIPMDQVRGIVPLTARARTILEGRLEPFGIALQEPWFEDEFRVHSYGLRVESSSRAGNKLVKFFAPDFQESPAHTGLVNSAALALAAKDFDGAVPGGVEPSSASETWVSSAFEWIRPTPYDYGALNSIFDAGGVLKKLQKKNRSMVDDVAMDQFRGIAKSMSDQFGNRAALVEILSSGKFAEATNMLQEKVPEAMPAGLPVLVLFLRWKEHFHRAGSNIHLEKLLADLRELQSSVKHADLIAALWLLGFYAGCERVMPLAYAAGSARYPWFCGERLEVAPLREEPHPYQESENRLQSEDDSSGRGETTAICGASGDKEPPESVESCDDSESPGVMREGMQGDLLSPTSNADMTVFSGLNKDSPGAQSSGVRPWKKHRKNSGAYREALREALREASLEHPDLKGADLYKKIAEEWFDYKEGKSRSDFLIELKKFDQNTPTN